MKSWCQCVMLLFFVGVGSMAARQQSFAAQQPNTPTYRVTMVPRAITVISYQHRGGATQIGFQGSPIMPNARGSARVESKQGRIQINAEFRKMGPAQAFGPEYLTYVLWAITPEGKSNNLGEVILDGDQSKMQVTTSLQTFGLVVTAEPYYAVAQPSNVVVLENTILPETKGTIEQADAKYQSLEKGQYSYDVSSASAHYAKSKTPLELDEARNAVQIAEAAGAQQYASDAFLRAQNSLNSAERLFAGKKDKKEVIQASRDAVQNAADARNTAINREQEEKAAQERAAEAQRTAQAQAEAAAAATKQQQEQVAREQAEQQAQRDAQARAEADAARQEAQQRAQQEQQAAAQAQQAAARAEQAKEQLRTTLLQQFNQILPTTDTPRGLKVNISDVLFDTGKYDLRVPAREALARLSGIVVAHPGLKLQVEGFTDSVESDTFNQTLSENRANSVRAYLINQGIDPAAITAIGYGKSNPVGSNDTATGKQQNRRVEIVISGEIIGTQIGRLNSESRP